MQPDSFKFSRDLPFPVKSVFDWHTRPGAFQRLTPPWENVELISETGTVLDGDRKQIRMKMGPIPINWEAVHEQYEEGVQFVDRQVKGPFAHWVHRHRFEPIDSVPPATHWEDCIEFQLPGGALGRCMAKGNVESKLQKMMLHRERVLGWDLADFERSRHVPRQRILITGATGLLGQALTAYLETQGHTVIPLGRRPVEGGLSWNDDFRIRELSPDFVCDTVIHLAGENLAGGRWTEARKTRFRSSRIDSTVQLIQQIQNLDTPPRTFIGASGISVYGNDPASPAADEETVLASGYFPKLAQDWESAATDNWPTQAGFRVAHLRLGMVLTPRGGALGKMLPAFRLGLGGPLGSGKQSVSWISLEDVLGVVGHLLRHTDLEGAFNVVAPQTLPQREWAKVLGKVLRRPAILPAPEFAIRAILGEMGNELLLRGREIIPRRLQDTQYRFRHPDLLTCFQDILGVRRSG